MWVLVLRSRRWSRPGPAASDVGDDGLGFGFGVDVEVGEVPGEVSVETPRGVVVAVPDVELHEFVDGDVPQGVAAFEGAGFRFAVLSVPGGIAAAGGVGSGGELRRRWLLHGGLRSAGTGFSKYVSDCGSP